MGKPIFQFRLRYDPTLYYYVDAGVVTTSVTPVNISKSVVDWDKLQIHFKRHGTYIGVFRSYAPEAMRFANDAAKILRYIFMTQGDTEAICELEVYKLNSTDQLYYPRCICTVNFSQYKNSLNYVNAALMEGGLSAKLNAYDTTDFEIELQEPGDDEDTEWIWISGDPQIGRAHV